MPKPMICLCEALRNFLALFHPCFSRRQWKYFVTVLLGLVEQEGRHTGGWAYGVCPRPADLGAETRPHPGANHPRKPLAAPGSGPLLGQYLAGRRCPDGDPHPGCALGHRDPLRELQGPPGQRSLPGDERYCHRALLDPGLLPGLLSGQAAGPSSGRTAARAHHVGRCPSCDSSRASTQSPALVPRPVPGGCHRPRSFALAWPHSQKSA